VCGNRLAASPSREIGAKNGNSLKFPTTPSAPANLVGSGRGVTLRRSHQRVNRDLPVPPRVKVSGANGRRALKVVRVSVIVQIARLSGKQDDPEKAEADTEREDAKYKPRAIKRVWKMAAH
jgi:hypothetical protein